MAVHVGQVERFAGVPLAVGVLVDVDAPALEADVTGVADAVAVHVVPLDALNLTQCGGGVLDSKALGDLEQVAFVGFDHFTGAVGLDQDPGGVHADAKVRHVEGPCARVALVQTKRTER